jgi:hypothetical protein|eukprot:COSAG01_NODE_1763_length_9284_cov_67.515079_7_plen_88_part_00
MSAVGGACRLLCPPCDPFPSEDEIRTAFKKQALLWHPDKNGGSAEATAHFQALGYCGHAAPSYPLRSHERPYVYAGHVPPLPVDGCV